MLDQDQRGTEAEPQALQFDDIFPELYVSAYRLAYRLCGSDEDAKDLAQDALVRAYDRWPKISHAEPSAWVARVVTNLAFDLWRRRRRFRTLRPPPAPPAASDDHVELYTALDALPKRQRQVVVLRYLGDQSEAATAATLDCSVGTVKQHAARGLAALRARLGAHTLPEELQ